MATPLLSLVIYAHLDHHSTSAPVLGAHTVASGRLKLDPKLDERVSLLATSELAKVSAYYAADLEATTHFMERLEAATKGITDQLVMPDDLAALDVRVQLDADAIVKQVMGAFVGGEIPVIFPTYTVHRMLRRAIELARR